MDESNGYESIAAIYIKGRGRHVNGIGSSTARAWARTLNKGSVVLDMEPVFQSRRYCLKKDWQRMQWMHPRQ
jgi:hypothetical protein